MKLKIPFLKQHTEYSCGPASLEMVLYFLGDKKSEKFLINEANTRKFTGTRHEGMISTATKEGFYCYVNSDSTFDEVKSFLSQGHPVIIDYTEPSENIGHYAVVVGYKGNRIIMNDPWNGRNFSIDEKELIERWHDSITKSRGWMMVISKKDLQLGKQYLPVKK